MPDLTLHIPLRLTRENGFFNEDAGRRELLGFPARLSLEQPPHCYLVLDDIPAEQAEVVIKCARRCLTWAAVRLDMGILTDREPLKRAAHGTFDGQFTTALPRGVQARPMRVEAKSRNEEPSTRLLAALSEAATKTELGKPEVKPSLLLACEFFASVDFEATPNAQFLMLTAVYEVLADPKPRPKLCVELIEGLLQGATKSQQAASAQGDRDMEEAFKALQDSAVHLKKESITSSIRKLATRTSEALGDPDPAKAGKRAAVLYGKRSQLVHKGKSVGLAEVHELRVLVREALAVEARCAEHIRQRYP